MHRGQGRPERRIAGLAALLCSACLLLVPQAASADIKINTFKVSSTSTLAGGHPDLTIGMKFCKQTNATNDINLDKYCEGTTTAGEYTEHTKTIALSLPPGLLANPRAVATCSAVNFTSNRCTAASEVGQFNAGFLVGAVNAVPLYVNNNKIYSIATRGNELMRLGFLVNMGVGNAPIPLQVPIVVSGSNANSGASAASEDVPHSYPVGSASYFKLVSLEMTLRGEVGSPPTPFMTNPTSCSAGTVSLTATSYKGGPPDTKTSPYTATGCAALAFSPAMNVSAGGAGQTARGSAPPIDVNVGLASNQSAVQRSQIVFPDSLRPSVASLAAHACDPSAHAASNCPETSKIGTITTSTPLVTDALSGPIYLIKRPGVLEIGLSADLSGAVNVSVDGTGTFDGNRAVATFDDLPDVPISQMAISLKGGSGGIFTAVRDLCLSPPTAQATLTGKNGKISALKVPINIEGCQPPAMSITSTSVTVNAGWAPITVKCASSGMTCKGTLSVGTAKGKSRSIGKAAFEVAAGTSGTVGVKLNKATLKAFKKKRKVKVRATSDIKASQTITLKAEPKAKKAKKKKKKKKKKKGKSSRRR